MILGLGMDSLEIERCKAVVGNTKFMKRLFTQNEIIEMGTPINPQTMAGKFCTKEAVSKALGVPLSLSGFGEIEVTKDEMGKPFVTLTGLMLEEMAHLGGERILTTITHDQTYAMAVAIVEGRECR